MTKDYHAEASWSVGGDDCRASAGSLPGGWFEMKGVNFAGDREIELRNFPDPEPGPREVIVAMKASGMCGSDLHGYRAPRSVRSQRPANVGGHEPCGVVVARGSAVTEAEAPIGMRAM